MKSSDFKPGDRIVLHGLKKNETLNGQLGTVMPEDDGVAIQTGAVRVHLDLGPEVALKPSNLQLFIRASCAEEKPAKEDAKSLGISDPPTANAAELAPGKLGAQIDAHMEDLLRARKIDAQKSDSLLRARQIAAQIAAQMEDSQEKSQTAATPTAEGDTENGALSAADAVVEAESAPKSDADGGAEPKTVGFTDDAGADGVEGRAENGAEGNNGERSAESIPEGGNEDSVEGGAVNMKADSAESSEPGLALVDGATPLVHGEARS